ncbi:MAG TPA: PQQ-binding-like beta-propeller repeat protein, partial [Vicinamibacterales bacterium]|nr:PQQ-binding-like beta-propeller repeat protein [Vicinamibacterales bacterium]
MPVQRWILVVMVPLVAGVVALAQPGRGGSQWPTARADAQRTSWIRADEKISAVSVAKAGFELQWKVQLENQPRGAHGLAHGVTAAGVTLFVPISVVAGSSNTVHAIDNDTGYVVWRRQFDLPLPAATPACAGGMTAGATRIVRLDDSATAAAPGVSFGRGFVGYRSLVGEPGEGVPVEGRAGGRGRSTGDPTAPPAAAGRGAAAGARGGAAAGRGTAAARPPVPGRSGAQPAERIPGAPRREEAASPFAFLFRESGVVYVTTSDGLLHVLGLPSGKDMQRPAPFVPPDAQPSAPVAVGTMLYTSTSGQCGGAPSAVWAIDLDSEAKPVVSWKTNGGGVVGAVAFTSDGTLIAAIGSGQTTADGKANAIVALDARTLKLKDWFTQPNAEFVTGPTILRHNERELVAAATKDGRLIVLDAASLGGADHATPLASRAILDSGGRVSADALAAWRSADTGAMSWILVPVAGRLPADVRTTNAAVQSGAVVALKLEDRGGVLSLQHGWVSHDLSAPATPVVVNGVVFALATGASAGNTSAGSAAMLHAYDGATGKRLWHSGKTMTAPASPGSLWSGLGQIYVGARDGTLHA